jgi:hemolysin III
VSEAVAAALRPARAASSRPRLRGWSHLGFAVPAAVATVVLVWLARGDAGRQLALLVYGASSVALFTVSGLYHVGTWSPPVRARWRRLDHSTIFLLIAGTYTPITLTLLGGGWKWAILAVIWGLAIAGTSMVVSPLRVPRALLAATYLSTGWVAVVALPVIARSASVTAMLLMLGAGLLYSMGAVCYATKRPRLSPRWFSYHEVFHLLVIGANALFYTVMVVEVVPHSH